MLYPNNIRNYNSIGEQILAQKFSQDPKMHDAFVLPSVFCSQHFKRVSGELDFLILLPNHGFFAIEVKHGNVQRKDGQWIYSNRNQQTFIKNRSPFDQVNKTMQSIKSYVETKIKTHPKLNQNFKNRLWGYGVAFTSIEINHHFFEPEAERWQIFDRRDIAKPISGYMEKLSHGWHHKYHNLSTCRWYSKTDSRPSQKDCYQLFQLLRGDFEFDYSEINRMIDSKNLINQYTREQFDILEQTRYNPRVLIEGPAGTGKTLMAMEMVYRKLKESKKVGFMCFTNSLANHLKKKLKQLQNEFPNLRYVKTFHSFMFDHIHQETQVDKMSPEEQNQFFNEDLPLEFLIESSHWTEKEKLDYLVIDEAQDLLKPNYLDVIDAALVGGLEKGSFCFVGDFYRQGLFNEIDGDQLIELILKRTEFTILKLTINCRNTREIAAFASILSGHPIPKEIHRSILGKQVDLRFPTKSKQLKEVIAILEQLREKIPLERVTILTRKIFANTLLEDSKIIQDFIETKGLTHSTIKSFKGLENDVVLLISDCNESNFEKRKNALYVACTRANHQLYIIFDNQSKSFIQNQISKANESHRFTQ
ncbi:MAG: AAA family ATPase [Flavobacteriaceae bacterium]|nr:AAA family ATPase [Flavobacteriaceae bacterium]